ncbi:hypothetical protein MNBD_GAMMA03-1463 [hydrothermal vent metagenome]|uniref:Uncharacterized protein n=1 Tax=hydrothermal vent metagenome TaxID=652676 RepID=A0A3B0W735_9ZZZZ
MKKFTLMILLLVSHIIYAQNAIVTYQGFLKTNGVPVNATVDFVVNYHGEEVVGPPIQSETFNAITVADGLFTLQLGSTSLIFPLEAMFGVSPDIWVELIVNGETQSPMQKISMSPYAVNSLSLDGREASEYALSTQITALINRINELENKTQFIDVVGTDMKITGANLNILSGSGATDGAINGLGNLVVGYNEPIVGVETLRSGSHNIIVGSEHSYSNYGGLVAGQKNTISGSFSSVTGGESNKSIGERSSITGGTYNIARGLYSVVVGGGNSTVIDGNEAYADYSVVVGGYRNITGDGVDANIGIHSVIIAGHKNDTKGDAAVVVGGLQNHANGSRGVVSGGRDNNANGSYSSISGGIDNSANGASSSISGGSNRAVSGGGDWRAGSLFEDN